VVKCGYLGEAPPAELNWRVQPAYSGNGAVTGARRLIAAVRFRQTVGTTREARQRVVTVPEDDPVQGLPDDGTADEEATDALPPNSDGPMFTRLPSLNLFRVFDAAARHRSFRAAASELCVTPSAISQQIRQLEDVLGVRLFRRLPQQVQLTREGVVLADTVNEALDMLIRGCNRLVDPSTPTVVCLNASTSLAARWLVPRLKTFMARYPRIKVTLLASNDTIDFKRQDIDVAIRWGGKTWQADVHADQLISDFHFPVCSPAYRAEHDLRTPRDLCDATILHEVNGSPWAAWFESANCGQLVCRDVLYFGDAGLMLEAAAQGQGVCLTNYLLADKDLLSGRLVKLFDMSVGLKTEGYYILTNAAVGGRPATTCLVAWLRQEAAQTVSQQLVAVSTPDILPEMKLRRSPASAPE
jgi:LysR family glycine cleavage system transcriptional activator